MSIELSEKTGIAFGSICDFPIDLDTEEARTYLVYKISIRGLKILMLAADKGQLTPRVRAIKYNDDVVVVSEKEFKELNVAEEVTYHYKNWRRIDTVSEDVTKLLRQKCKAQIVGKQLIVNMNNYAKAQAIIELSQIAKDIL